ncbi:ABC transporter ATP-binding protein [Pseudorhodoplanes sp.]|jgi:peptide/nickel transport system ATP-binding protein|uniref:ABC transporter ATP-binding protein n=1 Tax=Pseudorhodoplanes sp. TaxID=1934341 RepID=UPI002C929B9F|nr:ABC transporter ATP-binding protein [Pseudorhodoplanes sp.]HWV40520.1 ABC transporter ATP-binding protein [Pseudorhodoplanes sp.]
MTTNTLLDVRDLTVEFMTRRGVVKAVQHVNVTVAKGETVGIVGESGSGKSVTSYAVMRILDRAGRIADGAITFSGIDVRDAPEREMRDLRGREMSMIFQSPRTALNPIRKVGDQISDVLLQHVQAQPSDVKEKAIEALRKVRIARPEERFHAYPFELSGGMCQRVVIALALACQPQLLIADEPTTGLDVTTQKAVMDLVVELTRERGMSTILITHDLGLAAAYCDKVVVMEKGRVVETAASSTIFKAPQHAYTRKLMRATPRLGVSLRDLLPEDMAAPPLPAPDPAEEKLEDKSPLLVVSSLVKEYPRQGAPGSLASFFRKKDQLPEPETFKAVDGISFEIKRGESVGLVGESGCGKSTTSMMVMRLLDPTSGSVVFDGEDIGSIPAKEFAKSPMRKRIQMVFQDPTESLNPRFTAERAIADPIMRMSDIRGRDAIRARCEVLAGQVGLPVELLDRFPHQLSGGQKARVGIARAIALSPELVILDEPTAALDVSVQAVVLNLLEDLKYELGMSYLFVSHDLNVVRLLCDRVIVMRSGKIVEEGSAEAVMGHPKSDYTKELLAAIPHPPV